MLVEFSPPPFLLGFHLPPAPSNTQVPDEVALEEEVYEDEDDENSETNWRNDYPDEICEDDSDAEERFGGHASKLLYLFSGSSVFFFKVHFALDFFLKPHTLKKCWVKYNPALGKIWTNPVIGLLPRSLG